MNTIVPPSDSIRLSVVIPVLNEADNVVPLLDEVLAALSGPGGPGAGAFEVVFVDDGSTDATVAVLQPRLGETPCVRLLRHAARAGQSAAVRTGVKAARGEWVATLDGDGQNDPRDILNLIAAVTAAGRPEPVLAGGVRVNRRDTWSKRLGGRVGNGIRNAVLRDGCPDTGCGLKLFRRTVFLDLPYFAALHRFLPALVQAHGHRVVYASVNHRPRHSGLSKYTNLRRAMIGVVDLLGVLWLIRRTALAPSATETTAGGPSPSARPHPSEAA